MYNRLTGLASFAILLSTSALTSCAWVQTPHEYASTEGYRLIDVQGTKYFCRRAEPDAVTSSPTGVECLTRTQLSAKVAALNASHFPTSGIPLDGSGFAFESPGLTNTAGSTSLVNGQNLSYGAGR